VLFAFSVEGCFGDFLEQDVPRRRISWSSFIRKSNLGGVVNAKS
jgi:hypothetical protein